VVKNKYIILPFLSIAWTVIFAHGIFPHHHHQEIVTECSHSHVNHSSEDAEINHTHNDDNSVVCHFNVEILTRISLDNIFIISIENKFSDQISVLETRNCSFYIEFVSEQVPKSNYLRGPPQIS
jgi:hypothetical protein